MVIALSLVSRLHLDYNLQHRLTRDTGLRILPQLLPPDVQSELLSRLLHRDLSNDRHRTNTHLHYNVSYPNANIDLGDSSTDAEPEKQPRKKYPRSFFYENPAAQFAPKDPSVHKPISVQDFLNRKLRWMTLGGQYDWTRKEYPSSVPPPFPEDVAALVKGIFPDMEAQAAIVNLYAAGDTLSIHRDVSEVCDRGLASISLGCDALFVIGLGESASKEETDTLSGDVQKDGEWLVLRLRSGDAVFMDEEARFAWHGVPKVLRDTCPAWLAEWPDGTGWMKNKRINLNVRQMQDL